jgi:hypothetical protein
MVLLFTLGAFALTLILVYATVQSRRPVYLGEPVLAISELPTAEAYARVTAKDLLNAFARFIGASRAFSLDDRVYSFFETAGKGREGQPSDHAEYIAESAPLLRTDLIVEGGMRSALIITALVGEGLILICATVLLLVTPGYVEVARRIVVHFATRDYAFLLTVTSEPVVVTGIVVLICARFGGLFREIGIRFLGEVVFQSFMIAISISSSISQGRGETTVSTSEGLNFFDAGRTSTLRIRIQSAHVQTSTMVSTGGGADSLGGPRYIIAAQRADQLVRALWQVAHRYIDERTLAAATMVRSEMVEVKNVKEMLVDSGSLASLAGGSRTRIGYSLGAANEGPRRTSEEDFEDEA